MIEPLVLACVLWAQPDTRVIETPVSEYGLAQMSQNLNGMSFEADVREETLNYVQISIPASNLKITSYSTGAGLKKLTVRLEAQNQPSSLDCEVR